MDGKKNLDYKLLIVDDDPDVLELIVTKLRSEGYSCATAENAETALSMVTKEIFDVVLTDLILPGIDGFTLTEVLKAKHPTIGILAITGRADVDGAVRAMKAGADDYITKPFNFDHLIISLERTLEKQKLIVENKNYQQFLEQRIFDATREQENALTELRKTKEYLENLIESSVDSIISLDTQGNIQFCNAWTENLFGHPVNEIHGKPLAAFCKNGHEGADKLVYTTLAQGRYQNYEVEIASEEEESIIASVSASVLQDTEGKKTGIIAIFKDITKQKTLERELQELSIKDNLTSLYNQRHFYRLLQNEMTRAARQNRPLCLLLLDLDNFKQLNDSRGHLAGDKILEKVAMIIKDCTREHVDYTFRYGGDEFTIILTETHPQQALEVAERIKHQLPRSLKEAPLTLSMGLSEFTDSLTLEDFINSADKAMYESKRLGGNCITLAKEANVHSET
jgi:diguanylate cyclase (GGDEF)-like protein/PAS domain S-box-containing protein